MIEQPRKKSSDLFPETEVKAVKHKTSAKERALILANHVADLNMGEPSRLSYFEFENLANSFLTSRDIKVYNRIKDVDKCVRNVLPYLNQLQLMYHEDIAYLWGFYNLAYTFVVFQEIAEQHISDATNAGININTENNVFKAGNNIIRFKASENGKLKLDLIPSARGYSNSTVHTKQNKRPDSSPDEEITLSKLIDEYRIRSEEGAITLKSYIAAVKDYLIKEEAEIDSYWRKIREMEDNMRKNQGPVQLGGEAEKMLLKNNGYNLTYPVYDDLYLNQTKYNEFKSKYLL